MLKKKEKRRKNSLFIFVRFFLKVFSCFRVLVLDLISLDDVCGVW